MDARTNEQRRADLRRTLDQRADDERDAVGGAVGMVAIALMLLMLAAALWSREQDAPRAGDAEVVR